MTLPQSAAGEGRKGAGPHFPIGAPDPPPPSGGRIALLPVVRRPPPPPVPPCNLLREGESSSEGPFLSSGASPFAPYWWDGSGRRPSLGPALASVPKGLAADNTRKESSIKACA